MRTLLKSVSISALLLLAVACGGKKGGGIKSECEDNFAHGEMDNGNWSPGKGDQAKFMAYCLEQKPDVVRCSSMKIEFGDKSCEKHTGLSTDGFQVKMKLSALRAGQ